MISRRYPKLVAEHLSPGQALFRDAPTGKVSSLANGGALLGVVAEESAASEPTVLVRSDVMRSGFRAGARL